MSTTGGILTQQEVNPMSDPAHTPDITAGEAQARPPEKWKQVLQGGIIVVTILAVVGSIVGSVWLTVAMIRFFNKYAKG